jgi:hypothetical protein
MLSVMRKREPKTIAILPMCLPINHHVINHPKQVQTIRPHVIKRKLEGSHGVHHALDSQRFQNRPCSKHRSLVGLTILPNVISEFGLLSDLFVEHVVDELTNLPGWHLVQWWVHRRIAVVVAANGVLR